MNKCIEYLEGTRRANEKDTEGTDNRERGAGKMCQGGQETNSQKCSTPIANCSHTRWVEESPSLGPWRRFTVQQEQRAGAGGTITNTAIPLSAATYSLTETGFYRWCHRTGATSFPKACEERKWALRLTA